MLVLLKNDVRPKNYRHYLEYVEKADNGCNTIGFMMHKYAISLTILVAVIYGDIDAMFAHKSVTTVP
jgi:hypothetical protein